MHFDVDAHTIALVVSGSHAYGMGTQASDVDLRGVCVPPRSVRDSYFKRFEQWQSSARVEDGLDDVLTGAALDVLRERMLEFQQAALGVAREELDDAVHDAAARSLGLSADVLAVLGAERAYRKARKHWQQYLSWQRNRNPARAELEAKHGYDTKHASHLVRLMRTGTEILRDGVLRVRRPDAEELLAIRRGVLTYEEVIESADAEEQAMRRAAEVTGLPRSAPAEQIDVVLLEILAEHG